MQFDIETMRLLLTSAERRVLRKRVPKKKSLSLRGPPLTVQQVKRGVPPKTLLFTTFAGYFSSALSSRRNPKGEMIPHQNSFPTIVPARLCRQQGTVSRYRRRRTAKEDTKTLFTLGILQPYELTVSLS